MDTRKNVQELKKMQQDLRVSLQRGNDPKAGADGHDGSGFLDAAVEYPRATKLLLDNADAIHAELQGLLGDVGGDGRRWGVWAAEDYQPPKFTLLTPEQILERQETFVKDPDSETQWSLYGIILFGNAIDRGVRACPETYKVLEQIPGVVNAGFSCLGPHSETRWHDDVDRGFDRLHLPLIVPDGDIGFKVGCETRRWRQGHVLAFDDTFRHNAWNATSEARFVMIVDVKRSPARDSVRRK